MNIFQQIIAYFRGPHTAGQLLLDLERLAVRAEKALGTHNAELDYVISHIQALEAARTEVAKDAALASAVLAQVKQITDAVGSITAVPTGAAQ